MNKKANIFRSIFITLFIYVSGILILSFLLDDIISTRLALDCTNTAAISDGVKLTCLAIGGVTPYFLWFLISISLGFVIGRNI